VFKNNFLKKERNIGFDQFVDFFPEIELPVTLTEESSLDFSRLNTPFKGEAIAKFIIPIEAETDEFTEYLPCFRLKNTGDIHVLVYWKASLLNYEYKMVTFSKEGSLIDGKVIASTITNKETIVRTVSTIDEDWVIHTVAGQQEVESTTINKESKSYTLELLGTGEIIFSLNEEK
jgi:hypothetical protein